ncbi:hypothetical protein HID58_035959, partial [Brassica napus]
NLEVLTIRLLGSSYTKLLVDRAIGKNKLCFLRSVFQVTVHSLRQERNGIGGRRGETHQNSEFLRGLLMTNK